MWCVFCISKMNLSKKISKESPKNLSEIVLIGKKKFRGEFRTLPKISDEAFLRNQ